MYKASCWETAYVSMKQKKKIHIYFPQSLRLQKGFVMMSYSVVKKTNIQIL